MPGLKRSQLDIPKEDLSAADDPNPIFPKGQEELPQELTGEGIKGIRPEGSPEDAEPGPSKYAEIQSPAINRPPKPPADGLGPYCQFVTTKGDMWMGSILLLRRVGLVKPTLELTPDRDIPAVEQEWETLYENVCGHVAWRVNFGVKMLNIAEDTILRIRATWPHDDGGFLEEKSKLAIPNLKTKWRGGSLSCNGFDETAAVDVAQSLTYTQVWSHLGSVHLEKPLHLLLWGGDQNYIDFVFEDIPFLKRWSSGEMDWNTKWSHEFSAAVEKQVCDYHFNCYTENWERPEVKLALANVPSMMQWDDHDIFDGAGSYPPLLHDSPVMVGLFLCAQKFRLLFQHHTTHSLARKHQLFGVRGHNYLAQCGPELAILMTDNRSERTMKRVKEEGTWDMIFDRLDTQLEPTTQHLIALFPVPVSFVRMKLAEKAFDFLKRMPNKFRQLPIISSVNSHFGLPELYDDLLDEWTHDAHIDERNAMIQRMQAFSKKHEIRVTYMSGDVHCCGISRFRSPPQKMKPVNDHKMSYQIISSAIVNVPPPRNVTRAYHYTGLKWTLFSGKDTTEEEFLDVFERMPEGGRKLRHRKILPNRNWTYWEMIGSQGDSKASTPEPSIAAGQDLPNGATVPESHPAELGNGAENKKSKRRKPVGPEEDFYRLHYPFTKNDPSPSTLGTMSDASGKGTNKGGKVHVHSGGLFCSHKKGYTDNSTGGGAGAEGDLRMSIWVESSLKSDKGRQFASYSVIIPPLANA